MSEQFCQPKIRVNNEWKNLIPEASTDVAGSVKVNAMPSDGSTPIAVEESDLFTDLDTSYSFVRPSYIPPLIWSDATSIPAGGLLRQYSDGRIVGKKKERPYLSFAEETVHVPTVGIMLRKTMKYAPNKGIFKTDYYSHPLWGGGWRGCLFEIATETQRDGKALTNAGSLINNDFNHFSNQYFSISTTGSRVDNAKDQLSSSKTIITFKKQGLYSISGLFRLSGISIAGQEFGFGLNEYHSQISDTELRPTIRWQSLPSALAGGSLNVEQNRIFPIHKKYIRINDPINHGSFELRFYNSESPAYADTSAEGNLTHIVDDLWGNYSYLYLVYEGEY